jgi:hypothetical protein
MGPALRHAMVRFPGGNLTDLVGIRVCRRSSGGFARYLRLTWPAVRSSSRRSSHR